jgi:hypothetical protein
MIVNDDSRVISKRSCKLIDDTRVVIYNRNVFAIQATWFNLKKNFFAPSLFL